MTGFKIPESVLVVVHRVDLLVLLMERADRPGFWQSVTGSRHALDEPLRETARRELFEETGITVNDSAGPYLVDWNFSQTYEIYPHWRHRYAPGVTENMEHVFSICVSHDTPILLSSREHTRFQWLPYRDAAERCFSWSNAEMIRELPARFRLG